MIVKRDIQIFLQFVAGYLSEAFLLKECLEFKHVELYTPNKGSLRL